MGFIPRDWGKTKEAHCIVSLLPDMIVATTQFVVTLTLGENLQTGQCRLRSKLLFNFVFPAARSINHRLQIAHDWSKKQPGLFCCLTERIREKREGSRFLWKSFETHRACVEEESTSLTL